MERKLTRANIEWGRDEFSTISDLPFGTPCILTGPNWHMHNLDMGPTI